MYAKQKGPLHTQTSLGTGNDSEYLFCYCIEGTVFDHYFELIISLRVRDIFARIRTTTFSAYLL